MHFPFIPTFFQGSMNLNQISRSQQLTRHKLHQEETLSHPHFKMLPSLSRWGSMHNLCTGIRDDDTKDQKKRERWEIRFASRTVRREIYKRLRPRQGLLHRARVRHWPSRAARKLCRTGCAFGRGRPGFRCMESYRQRSRVFVLLSSVKGRISVCPGWALKWFASVVIFA